MSMAFVSQSALKSPTATIEIGPFWSAFAVTAIMFGVVLRFYNLDGLSIWEDEIIHLQHANGWSKSEFHSFWRNLSGQIVTAGELQIPLMQDTTRDAGDVVRVLAAQEPQSPPLHYVLLHVWRDFVGESISSYRALSAVFGCVLIAATYWLAIEIFQDRFAALITTSLVSLSPVMVMFSLEIRLYSLWIALVALATAALLRAMREDKSSDWVIYALLCLLGLYTFPLTALLMGGHVVYFALVRGFQWDRMCTRICLALGCATLLYVPWMLTVFSEERSMNRWREQDKGLSFLLSSWRHMLSVPIVDLPLAAANRLSIGASVMVGCVFFLSLTVTILKSSARTWLLIVMLLTCIWLPMAALDITAGGIRSSVDRYLLPTHLGVLLVLAFVIYVGITSVVRSDARAIAGVLWCGLIAASAFSSTKMVASEHWRVKNSTEYMQDIARALNQTNAPLVYIPFNWKGQRHMSALSFYLPAETEFNFSSVDGADLAAMTQATTSVVVLTSHPEFFQEAEAAGLTANEVFPAVRLGIGMWTLETQG